MPVHWPKKTKHFKAVLFDMDGVIVDSMPYHYISWYEALKPFGIRATAFDAYSREGEKWQKTLKELFQKNGIELTPAAVKRIFRTRSRVFKKFFKPSIFEGAEDFIRCLKNGGYRIALVTGTPVNEVKKILPKRILSMFSAVVGGDMLKRGKPFPDPYLRAAKLLTVRPQECCVVENAPLGIRAAKSAGMFCFAVTTSLPRQYLTKADMIVDRLDDIFTKISKQCRI